MSASVDSRKEVVCFAEPPMNNSQDSSSKDKLTVREKTYLGLTEAYRYTCCRISHALGLTRLSKVTITAATPVCLLGRTYPDLNTQGSTEETPKDVTSQFEEDLSHRLWFSYRTGFPAIGEDKLTGDVGWGCTLRSCQMMLAQAISTHFLGRSAAPQKDVQATSHVLSHFHDSPEASLSIHSICAAGTKYGLVPGRWMGPYALCRAVADIAEATLRSWLRIVVIDSGGGAPCLDPDRLREHFGPYSAEQSDLYADGREPSMVGLLVLVPVVLGIERLNEVYSQQLQEILRWSQSAGIVGGRPGHSYYFMGYQGGRLICMDPHVVQATDKEAGLLSSHRPEGVQSVDMSAIDSTMALGFYCHSPEELECLIEQVRAMSSAYSRNPLLSLGRIPEMPENGFDCSWDDDGMEEGSPIVFDVSGCSDEEAEVAVGKPTAGQATPTKGREFPGSQEFSGVVGASLGSGGSQELANTGVVGGWEIVQGVSDTQATEAEAAASWISG